MNAVWQGGRGGAGQAGWWLRWYAAGLLAACFGSALAQGNPSEAAVKGAYVYKFLPYVQWPANALASGGSALVVGVAGGDAVYAELQALIAGRRVDGRPVEVRRVRANDVVDDLHVLFVGRSALEAQVLQGWAKKLKGRPVLVVTDVADGLEHGAMLNLHLSEGRVRFGASAAAAEQAGLRLSARLLALADRVVPP